MIEISELDFDSALVSSVPVLVDFWAPWCGPCKLIAPMLEDISEEYESKLTVVKVNADGNKSLLQKYGIRGIPTLMIFKDGEVVSTKVGAMTKLQLKEFVDGVL